jgi:hypothetical protein
MPFAPQARSYDGKQVAESARPLGKVSQVAQQEINRQRDPDLPPDNIGLAPRFLERIETVAKP